MNRRHFIAATGATLLTLLAGCKTEQDGEKFVGYWKSDSKYDPDVIHIARMGEKRIAYDEKADMIVSDQMKARRATEAEYQAIAGSAITQP
jgi:hypothetical protein